jgi:hypothetical protein
VKPVPRYRVLFLGHIQRLQIPVLVKYRRFTRRRFSSNTGKVIEIAKKKARVLNRRVTGAKNRKNSPISRDDYQRMVVPASSSMDGETWLADAQSAQAARSSGRDKGD